MSGDGTQVAAVNKAGVVMVWQTNGTELWHQEVHEELTAVAFSPDDASVLTGGDDNTVTVWKADSGALVARRPGHHDTITAIGFAPGGRVTATGSDDRSIIFWDTTAGRSSGRFIADSGRVTDLAFSPDGRQLATAGGTGMVRLWPLDDVEDGSHTNAEICQAVHDHVTTAELKDALDGAKPEVCTNLAA